MILSEKIESGLNQIGIEVPMFFVDEITILLAELVKWNKTYNLTAIKDERDMVEKHILDSLTVSDFLPDTGSVLDVGSGAGFPVIPLAMLKPGLEFYSIDAVGKKIRFQNHIKRILKLNNFFPIHGRVEDVGSRNIVGNGFSVIVSRAFSSIPLFLKLTEGLLAPGGRVISMKGAEGEQEISNSEKIISDFGFYISKKRDFHLPFSGSSRLLVELSQQTSEEE